MVINVRYPKFLEKDGVIGLVAPAFGCNIEPYQSAFTNAIERWNKMGYKTELGPNCFLGNGIGISNTPEKCGEEIMKYYLSESNDCLLSCGGGELMCEILDYIDFEKIKFASPKWFMGYSDNTNFTFLLTTLCDTASIYGPNAPAFGMEPWHASIYDAMDVLTGAKQKVVSYEKWEKEKNKSEENPLLPYNCTQEQQIKIFVNGQETDASVEMKGRLIGGCMDCLGNLIGTSFDRVEDFLEKYKEDGFIWFLESCDLNVFSIRRAMWQMKHAGWFKYVKGFLIGRPYCHGQDMMGLDQYTAVLSMVESYRVPIVMDVDLGHLPPMMPLVTGSVASLSATENKFCVNMEYI